VIEKPLWEGWDWAVWYHFN